MSEKRLITAQRCHDEGLAFEEYTIMITDDGVEHVRAKITDAAGVVYDAMLCEDSKKVTDHFATYDCAETFMRLTRPLASLCYSWWCERYSEIMRDANGELYLYRYHCNIGYSDYYYRFRNAQDLAAAIFDLDEYQILEFPETGHWAVSLPKEVRDEIWKTTSSRRDTIVQRLRREPAEVVESVEQLHAEVKAALARLTGQNER